MTIEGKRRHGCLSLYLIVIVVVSGLTALLGGGSIGQGYPPSVDWIIALLTLVSLLHIVFAIALFRWKEWGFWGIVTISIVFGYLSLMLGLGMFIALVGLVGIGVLYTALQVGSDNKGWPQLE